MSLTPEERKVLERRSAELKARMDRLRPETTPENVEAWAALYEERETIDRQLGDDGAEPGERVGEHDA